MEEQKKNKTLKITSNNTQEQKKLTYEQLNDACNQLFQQNRQLAQRNRELEDFWWTKRIDVLFKVIEHSSAFNSDFVVTCVEELENAIKIPQKEENKEEESKGE